MAYNYKTESARWAAIRDRDSHAEGHFVYCVKTTKIFCRPTCKARLCRRSNVEFYETNAEAQAAGYRACKRCKPELAKFVPGADQSIEKVRQMLERLPEDAPLPRLEDLAKSAGLTKYHFHRCFKRATGSTPREYALSRRATRRMCETVSSSGVAGEAAPATPALTDDSIEHFPTSITTPKEAQTPGLDMDFNFDEWLNPGPEDATFPILFEDYATPFSMTDGDLNSIIPSEQSAEPSAQPDTNSKALFPSLHTIPIHYTTIDTTHGVLLMAFDSSQISKLELCGSIVEAMESLGRSFPIQGWKLVALDELPLSEREVAERRVAAVVEALEMPFGKTFGVGVMTPPAEGVIS